MSNIYLMQINANQTQMNADVSILSATICVKSARIRVKNFICLLFVVVIWCLVIGICTNVFAATLDLAKTHFLQGDYESAINDCRDIIKAKPKTNELAEAYYFLGLSYLKTQNFRKAEEIFNLIIQDFKDTKFTQEATLGLGEVYFEKGDFEGASQIYETFIRAYPKSDFLGSAYFVLGRSLLKQGKWQEAKENLVKVQQEYPLSFEANLAKDLLKEDFYFTVQVGSFTKQKNAQSLCQKLKDKGLDAFVQEENIGDSIFYRVRVGKLISRQETENLEKQLKEQGYPTKIFP